MKRTKIVYWVSTFLFAAFMAFTAIPNVTLEPESLKMMSRLGYPAYFIRFIGIAKLLGGVAIVIPGFYRVKEWAYAGLFFDLIAAMLSVVMVFGVNASLLFMAVPLAVGAVSYVFYHKMHKV